MADGARRDGLYLMLLGTAAFLLFGVVLMIAKQDSVEDFRTAYYRGTCLLQHCDPYSEADIRNIYTRAGGPLSSSDRTRLVETRNIYLPTEFPFLVPLALLPFHAAEAFWIALIAGSFICASYAIGRLGAIDAPIISAALVAFCLSNSASLLYFANPAGFVVPFTVLSACFFIREKFVWAGIVFLAASLAFKPHDSALVWLYFLLARGTYRKHALQTLAVATAISLPAVLWVTQLSPHWVQEMSSNILALSIPGSVSDPSLPHGTCGLTNLQTITSFFWPDPHSYNFASYLICAPLFLVWGFITLRSRPSAMTVWLALASVSALSMLPVYHRQYDAKLILLAIPACAQLWSRRDSIGWTALLLTTAAFVLNGDLPWVAFLAFLNHMRWSTAGPSGRLLTAAWDFPVPLSLLAMGLFYLWIYARLAFSGPRGEGAKDEKATSLHPAAV